MYDIIYIYLYLLILLVNDYTTVLTRVSYTSLLSCIGRDFIKLRWTTQ